MPKLNIIPEIEEWIEQNSCKGKPSVFKVMIFEPDGEGVYTQRVEGTRYKTFGVHENRGGYCVTHLATGGLCHRPLSSERSARRLAFCLMGLTDWKKVSWKDVGEDHIPLSLADICIGAFRYCAEAAKAGDAQVDSLVETITPLLLSEEPGEEEFVPEAVSFSGGSTKGGGTESSQGGSLSGWGTTITT